MEQVEDSTEFNENCEENDTQKPRKRRNPFKVQQLKDEKKHRQKKRSRLIIRNISFKATEELLRKHFEQWGIIEDLVVLKREDGKLVGCAFVQYETINQATKAILKANNQPLLGRSMFVDWAVGKDEYVAKKHETAQPKAKKPKLEVKEENVNSSKETKIKQKINENNDNDEDEDDNENDDDDDGDDGGEDDNENSDDDDGEDNKSENEQQSNESDDGDDDVDDDDDDDDDDKKNSIDKKKLKNELNIKKEKHISNDVQAGCTVFIKNIPFDVEDDDLRKVCRRYGPIFYAIINREKISGHSKGTAFVKFKTKESADLALQAGPELSLMNEILEILPALSRDEIQHQSKDKLDDKKNKDSRNLYLAREGLIMSGSKAADGVSASDMTKRHKLELIKTQVLKNLNRFISRNRLSIHNLPMNYDNDTLKQMVTTFTGYKTHECRVMRENKITPEHPKGKSKGFGFMSFSTHQEALTALRKLNNNPKIFGDQHRPIVAFSIEDRAVHKIKEKRTQKSKLNNPTFKEKLEKRKELRKLKKAGKMEKTTFNTQNDNKTKLKKHIKKLEEKRTKVKDKKKQQQKNDESFENYVGMAAKPGTTISMRSNKKINEQSREHLKRVKADKRKKKQQKIKQIHSAERKQVVPTKKGKKFEKDELAPLVNKYKQILNRKTGENATTKVKKHKRTKWYTE